jgi:two-component system chemotaxis response regulator CheY
MMSDLGYQIEHAANGQEALAALAANSGIALALVDWNMPVMNGLEFVQAVRHEEKWNHVSLMMVTTETDMANVVQALEAGANEYVMKPFTREIIAEKLGLLGIGTP